MAPKLTLEALEVLDAIERKGSFAAAAAALYRVPSKITYTVNKLEEDLGVSLFQREGRRSVLTPAGRLLMEQGREILAATERLVETTRQVDSGWESRLNIAIDTVVDFNVVEPVLAGLYQLRPELEVSLYEEVLGGSWEALTQGRVDAVIGATDPELNTQGLRVEKFGDVQWLFVVSRDHPLRERPAPLSSEDIAAYRVVVIRDSSRELPALTRNIMDTQQRLLVPSMEYKIRAQVAGLGVGFAPRSRIEGYLQSGDLVAIDVEGGADSALNLAWRANNRGKALSWLVDQLANTALS